MSYSLKGRNILITGGSRGLGALVAERFGANGANIAINYITSEDQARKAASKIEVESKVKTVVIQGDVASQEDCVRVVKAAIEKLGGLDVVISNAGWTKFAEFGDLHALSEDDWDKCWATNVKGNFHLFREALPTFNLNPEGGAFIITSSTAAISATGSSMAYSVTKAAGLHLMKTLAQTQGPKVRINAVLPGLLLTEWGQRFSPEQRVAYENRTVLKRVATLEDCADVFITLATNMSITGQLIPVDGGFIIR
ncbi:hypothetical protein BDV36DRAFT_292436 [Aspergillus pseudocaelatus]|uniref:NAD(P)-binding protein n=1 Tax=Aspergillus pseudocaelatus TaxID=1825620 RepID=A0ABQ6WVX4_9EURO|nr:hypothetical protein BDV36DRAFT_292436 [Aspergillus pseudocaelatus]